MQALILADREIIGLTGLGNSNEPWMVEIDGVPIIERMLTQLDNSVVSRIILITRDNKESLIEFTKRLNLKTELVFLENKFYKESKSIYSIFLGREYLSMDDTVILNSQLVLEDNLLESILETDGECVVSVDIYKNWMTGKPVFVDGNARVLSVGQEPQMASTLQLNSYRMVGICKFDMNFTKKYFVPVLETIIDVQGDSLEYSEPLNVIAMSNDTRIKALRVSNAVWREINNTEDINQATILFSKDKKVLLIKCWEVGADIGDILIIWIIFIL